MKRHFILLSILGALLLLGACSANENTTGSIPTQTVPDDTTVSTTTATAPPQTSTSIAAGFYFPIGYETEDSYNAHVFTFSPAAKLMPYDTFRCLGEFESFVFLTDARFGACTDYMFSIRDPAGYNLSLYVEPNTGTDTPHGAFGTVLPFPSDPSNLRINNTKESCSLLLGDIQYSYNPKGLNSISWTQNGLWFTLSGSKPLMRDYPADVQSFVGGLLNADTAQETLRSLKNAISQQLSASPVQLRTVESFQREIKNRQVPSGFIRNDQLECIGSFVSFTWLSDIQSGDTSRYQYELRDKTGRILFLKIEEDPSLSLHSTTTISSTPKDTREWLTGKESGVFLCDSIAYHYTDGALVCISWLNNGKKFTLSSPDLTKHLSGYDTFLNKLLSDSSAGEAITALDQALKN